MPPDAPYIIYIILLCLTPDDFIRQGESAATHWVKETIQYNTDMILYFSHVL